MTTATVPSPPDLKTMRAYVRRARLVTDSPVKLLDI